METKELNMADDVSIAYEMAQKKVRKLKRFYVHVIVYVFVNIFLFVTIIPKMHGNYFALQNFSTAFYWGIGLIGHGLSVFVPTLVLGQKWEERKIKEFVDQEKNNKWE